MRAAFMAAASTRFRLKDLGAMSSALGAAVNQDLVAGTVTLSLERYIGDTARRFDLHADNHWADIPAPLHQVQECKAYTSTDAEVSGHLDSYRAIVGVIVHVYTFCRPDLGYVASYLSSVSRPGPPHLRLARRAMGYLARTAALCLTYHRTSTSSPMSMAFTPLDGEKEPDRTGLPHLPVDADHGVSSTVSGWLFMLAGCAISWAVRSNASPSLSSSESELYGLSQAVADLCISVNGMDEIGFIFDGPIPIFTDSRGARLLASDCAAPARTRHIHRRWYFCRWHVEEGKVKITQIKGVNNPSNFLTKAVGGAHFAKDRAYSMGLR
jgi:hypothetical protein